MCWSQNFRPSVPARLGIDYPRLKKINPRLVYCGLTGYGDRGRSARKAASTRCCNASPAWRCSRAAGRTKPQLVLGSVLDYFTSALLAYGVAAALFHRERSGTGPVSEPVIIAQRADDPGRAFRLGRQRGPGGRRAIPAPAG